MHEIVNRLGAVVLVLSTAATPVLAVAAQAQQASPVSPPRLVSRVDPVYPGGPGQPRPEGIVVLSAIVDTEGNVVDPTVIASVDPELDRAAIEAVRQWRYEPATLNGTAVNTRIRISIAFARTGAAPAGGPARLQWPNAFPESAVGEPSEPWQEARSRTGALEIQMPYLPEWNLQSNPAPNLLVAHARDWSRAFTVTEPRAAPFRIDQPMPPDALADAAARLAATASASRVTPLAVGQVRAPNGTLWIWFEYDAPSTAVATGLSLLDRMAFENARAWTFASTLSGHFVTVTCDVLMPRSASEAEARQLVAGAAADCARMITGFTTRTP